MTERSELTDMKQPVHDGDTHKIGRNVWGEFVHTVQGNRAAWRLLDRFGRGVLVEGVEEMRYLRDLLDRAISTVGETNEPSVRDS